MSLRWAGWWASLGRGLPDPQTPLFWMGHLRRPAESNRESLSLQDSEGLHLEVTVSSKYGVFIQGRATRSNTGRPSPFKGQVNKESLLISVCPTE